MLLRMIRRPNPDDMDTPFLPPARHFLQDKFMLLLLPRWHRRVPGKSSGYVGKS